MNQNNHRVHGPYEKFFKRLLDVVFSFLALLVLSPILLIIAILVRIKLGSPVIFKQERPGKDEKIFKLYKFRTMTDERDKKGELLSDEKRLTRFGRILRSSSLDELPELFNILKGDMSFVGPRPLLVEYLPYYTKAEHHRHDVRPGLTGLAQVSGRNHLKWSDRFKKDLEYVNRISLKTDIRIFLLTIKKVLCKNDIQMGEDFLFSRLDIERCPKPVLKKICFDNYKTDKDDLYDCILELKMNDANESTKILEDMGRFLNDKTAIVYCAYVNKKVIGFIWGYYISKNTIHINYFSVLRKYRNNGIGTKILHKMVSDNKGERFELLVDRNNKAINFYIKNGFRKINYNKNKYKMLMG